MAKTLYQSNDLQEMHPMSGDNIPYKDLENSESLPKKTSPNPIQEETKDPKKSNKLIKSLIIIGGAFITIILLLFIVSLFLKNKPNINPNKPKENPVDNKESTESAIPKEITDKYNDLEKALNDDNYNELDVIFPQLDWNLK